MSSLAFYLILNREKKLYYFMLEGIKRFFSDYFSYRCIGRIYAKECSGEHLGLWDRIAYNESRGLIRTNRLIYDVNGDAM